MYKLHPELHRRYFERVGDLNPENLSAYKPDYYQPSEEDFKIFFNGLFKSDKCLILQTLNCNSIVNRFAVCMNSISIFLFHEQMYLLISIDEIAKNQNKSINETCVSSISTDWSIQSISIKSDLPIFFDLSIEKSIPILVIDYSGISG